MISEVMHNITSLIKVGALMNYKQIVTSNTTAVGSYSQGVSPYGMFDMAGNVSE
jgi:formylglycine-generating enzyme required for sulfatase activity